MANIRKFPDAGLPLGYSIQPGSELIYHDTGLIEGTVVIKATDQNRENRLREMVGTRHPKDNDVFLYALRDRSLPLDVDEGTFDCIGTVDGEDTARIVVPVPSKEMVPIEAHPKFFTGDMAGPEASLTLSPDGNYASGANGSRFSVMPGTKKITGFLGFLGQDAPLSLRPVRFYERNTPVLRATYYTWVDPKFDCASVIVENPTGAPNCPGIKNWLRSAPNAERVGTAAGFTLWKISIEYVGSETGWNEVIYSNFEE